MNHGSSSALDCVAAPSRRSTLLQSWLAHLDRWDAIGSGADDVTTSLSQRRASPRAFQSKGSRASSTSFPAPSLCELGPGRTPSATVVHCSRSHSGLSSDPSSPLDADRSAGYQPHQHPHLVRVAEPPLHVKS
eukprot:GGOE01008364.1.p1 GENE.GGOE01008364.1~~GGOE01008364.1.p1  ORF type:complete len:142 (+),score=10.39 GGOE01008364.1:29-427(+)